MKEMDNRNAVGWRGDAPPFDRRCGVEGDAVQMQMQMLTLVDAENKIASPGEKIAMLVDSGVRWMVDASPQR